MIIEISENEDTQNLKRQIENISSIADILKRNLQSKEELEAASRQFTGFIPGGIALAIAQQQHIAKKITLTYNLAAEAINTQLNRHVIPLLSENPASSDIENINTRIIVPTAHMEESENEN